MCPSADEDRAPPHRNRGRNLRCAKGLRQCVVVLFAGLLPKRLPGARLRRPSVTSRHSARFARSGRGGAAWRSPAGGRRAAGRSSSVDGLGGGAHQRKVRIRSACRRRRTARDRRGWTRSRSSFASLSSRRKCARRRSRSTSVSRSPSVRNSDWVRGSPRRSGSVRAPDPGWGRDGLPGRRRARCPGSRGSDICTSGVEPPSPVRRAYASAPRRIRPRRVLRSGRMRPRGLRPPARSGTARAGWVRRAPRDRGATAGGRAPEGTTLQPVRPRRTARRCRAADQSQPGPDGSTTAHGPARARKSCELFSLGPCPGKPVGICQYQRKKYLPLDIWVQV